MSSVNKDAVIEAYQSGASLPDIEKAFGVARSTARHWIKKAGKLRSRATGVRLSAHKISAAHIGSKRNMTDEWRNNIAKARAKWGAKNATGYSRKPNGYVEHTTGPHKGRSQHVVIMETRLGRSLRDDECVHHIDGDKTNNNENNLALVTRSGHARLHRREERLSKGASQ